MKNITDFFGVAGVKKPKASEAVESNVEAETGRKRRRKPVKIPEDFLDEEPPSPPTKKRPRKKKSTKESNGDAGESKAKKRNSKRKINQNGDQPSPPDVNLTEPELSILEESTQGSDSQEVTATGKKKRKLSVEKMSPPEEVPDYSPPSLNNSLLNYFNKVDKTEGSSTPKLEKPIVLKVKAMVHDPPPADPQEKKKRSPNFEEVKMKLRISLAGGKDKKQKKSEKPTDYDVIVCESVEEPVVVNGEAVTKVPDTQVTPECDGTVMCVDLIDENSNTTPCRPKTTKPAVKVKHDGTLASFFTIGNRVPKPIVQLSEEQKQAKQNFLQSGSPANIKKIVASSGSSQIVGTPAPLPTVSHVLQKDPMHIIWNLPPIVLEVQQPDFTLQLPTWSAVTRMRQTIAPRVNGVRKSHVDPTKFDQKKELKLLKKDVSMKFRSAKLMKHFGIVEFVAKKFNSMEPLSMESEAKRCCAHQKTNALILESVLREEGDHNAEGLPVAAWFKDLRDMKKDNEGLIWSEKYKPKSVVHLSLANVRNVEKLQSWLINLRDCTKKDETEEYNSEDDFIVDDSCDGERSSTCRRAALITGPSGIGKTAVVYAVASELGFEVLELNASTNRSGKRILHEFSEALQSHKVEANHMADLNGKKGAKKKKLKPALPKKSLILIEDADLVFTDNDDGFLSTAATLAASSKRPVVFIANERGCKHLLTKIAPHLELELHFSSLRRERLNSWLRTICIAENLTMSSSEIEQLIIWTKQCDIRKSLLQLEFLGAGNRNITNALSVDGRSSSSVWNKLGDLDLSCSSSQDHLLQQCLKLLTVADILLTSFKTQLRNDNPCQRYWETDMRDSTELVSSSTPCTSLLTDEMASYSLSLMDNLLQGQPTCCHKESKREESVEEMEQFLLSPSCLLNRSTVALDFSPALREIARSEQVRFSSQTKRNNRYFHYLRPDDPRAALKMDFDLLSKPFSQLSPTELSIEPDTT